jgi:hypothetical protein
MFEKTVAEVGKSAATTLKRNTSRQDNLHQVSAMCALWRRWASI